MISGETSRSCQIADAWVIVTSLSTPSPATTMPASTSPEKSSVGSYPCSVTVSSLVSPVSRATETATDPMTATSVSPNSVPTSAVVVRAEKPCAR